MLSIDFGKHFDDGDIVIEAGTADNSDVLFPPARGVKLRGRFDPTVYLVTHPRASRSQIRGPVVPRRPIPGQLVALNPAKRLWRIVDPLGFDELRQLRDETEQFLNAGPVRNARPRPLGGKPEQRRANLSGSECATCWWWMRKLAEVDEPPQATLVHGDFRCGSVTADGYARLKAFPKQKLRVLLDFDARSPYIKASKIGTPRWLDEWVHHKSDAEAVMDDATAAALESEG